MCLVKNSLNTAAYFTLETEKCNGCFIANPVLWINVFKEVKTTSGWGKQGREKGGCEWKPYQEVTCEGRK